jgi:hypothetical protein
VEWEVEYTNEFDDWFQELTSLEQEAVAAAVAVLGSRGPALGRPLVDTVKQSRHANMKELRPPIGNVRVLFAFDPRRAAILLLGGDKTNRWRSWYQDAIPRADRLYDEHLDELRREGLIE